MSTGEHGRRLDDLLRRALPKDHPDHPDRAQRLDGGAPSGRPDAEPSVGGQSGVGGRDPLDALSWLAEVEPPTEERLRPVREAVLARLREEAREGEAAPVGSPSAERAQAAPAPPAKPRRALVVGWAIGVVLFGVGSALAITGKMKPSDPIPWIQAGAGLVVIAMVGARAAATEGSRVALALLSSVGIGLILAAGDRAGWSVAVGVKCFLFEQMTSLAPVLTLIAVDPARGRRPALSWATVAAAGAASGLAALHLVCPTRDELPHLLAFHLTGVVAASLWSGGLAFLRERRLQLGRAGEPA